MTAEAIVIGGGIVGASLAYHLVKEGISTMLIDRHDTGRATDAGAGILSPETSGTTSDDWYRFGMNAFAYYYPLIEALKEEQAHETGFERCGLLRLAVSDDELTPYEESRQLVFGRQRAYQYPSISDLHEITPTQAAALFPALAPVQKAFYHRTAARVDGRLLTKALTAAAVNQGLRVSHQSVEQLLIQDGRVTGVVADGERFTAGQVAIAGGAWSAAFEEQVGLKIPVAPQRGQIIHLQLDVETAGWPVLHPFHGHYMVAWPGGRVAVGATRETDSGFAPYPTAAGVREVLDEALRVAPGLKDGRIVDIRVGLRPYSADTLPILGTVPTVKNLHVATGHGPTGLQLGPYSGKVVADLMVDKLVNDDIEPFHIGRFSH